MADNKKLMEILPHALGIITGFLGPLIMYFVTEDKSKAKEEAKKAFNWQIPVLIALVVVMIVAGLINLGFLTNLVFLVNLIFCVIAIIKVNNGEKWDYPVSIPILK